MSHSDLLLVNPPFTSHLGPLIGIPILASYLKKHEVSVSAYDMNLRVMRELLTKDLIKEGIKYLEERFFELNESSSLPFRELVEYRQLVLNLIRKRELAGEYEKLRSVDFDFETLRNSRCLPFLLSSSTGVLFPEHIDFIPGFIKHNSFSPYSSADLMAASRKSDFYYELYENLLEEDVFAGPPPKVLGLSVVMYCQIIPAMRIAAIVKKRWPSVHITMGGAFVSVHMREISNSDIFSLIDSIILDEGEEPLRCLVSELSSGNPNFEKVPNMIYMRDNQIVFNKKNCSPKKLSFSSDYSVFKLDDYLYSRDTMTARLCLTRGCQWRKCSFCRTDLPMVTEHFQPTPESMYEELRRMVTEYGFRKFQFTAPFAPPEAMEYLANRIIRDKLKIQWHANTRFSEKLDLRLAKLMRESGCVLLMLGTESFSDRLLKSMNKGISCELIERVLTNMNGIVPIRLLMIVGYPTETVDEARSGYEKIKELMRRKLITSYRHMVVNLSHGSDMCGNPGKYQIENFRVPDDQDLFPDIYDFDCPGMSREQAVALQYEFDHLGRITVPEVYARKQMVSLNHDMSLVSRTIMEKSLEAYKYPFAKWIDLYEDEIF